MACERLLTSPRARRFGRYPSSLATVLTRFLTSGVIRESFFSARETVVGETFAREAISTIVTFIAEQDWMELRGNWEKGRIQRACRANVRTLESYWHVRGKRRGLAQVVCDRSHEYEIL